MALLTWSLQLTYQTIESNKKCVNLQCGEAGRTLKITWEDYTKYISPILCCQNHEPLIFFLPFLNASFFSSFTLPFNRYMVCFGVETLA